MPLGRTAAAHSTWWCPLETWATRWRRCGPVRSASRWGKLSSPPTPTACWPTSSPAAPSSRGPACPRWPAPWTSATRATSKGCAGRFPRTTSCAAQLTAVAVADAGIQDTIRQGEARHGHVFCPHTATAVHVLEGLRARGDSRPWAVCATAHPAKFETVVEPLVGHPVDVPSSLAALLSRPAHAEPIAADPQALRAWLLRST